MTLLIPDALSFFRQSCGRWRSQRSNHHLLHRRAEAGSSLIVVEELIKGDERLATTAELNGYEPERIIGGCWVRWSGSMAWDKAGENHEDETIFGLIPNDEQGRSGLLLRDRGYAEKPPVAGQFSMDKQDGLILVTDYGMMSSYERFWFLGTDVRLRSSTLQGLSNSASFSMEIRVNDQESGSGTCCETASRTNQKSSEKDFSSSFGW